MRIKQQLRLVLPLVCLLAVGCGKQLDLAPVSGTVTLDGEPVDGIRVTFEPVIGEVDGVTMDEYYTSFGITDENGHYEMKTEFQNELQPGALVGNHTVRLVCMKTESFMNQGLMDQRMVYDLPPRANDKSIKFTVPPEGTSEANFDL